MKTLSLITAISLVLFANINIAYSQTFDFSTEIAKLLTSSEKVKIANATEEIKIADKIQKEAKQFHSEEKYKNANKKYSKAAKIYTKNYKIIYYVYNDYLNELIKNSEGVKKMKLVDLKMDASNYFRKSITLRKMAHTQKDIKQVSNFYSEAHKMNLETMQKHNECFAIGYAWIDYDFSSYEEKVMSKASRKKESKELKNFEESSFVVIDDGSGTINYDNSEDVLADNSSSGNNGNSSDNSNSSNGKSYDNSSNNNSTQNTNNTNSSTNNSANNSNNQYNTLNDNVVFKIQILASKVPFSKSHIRRIYSKAHVVTERNNGMYKYLFGNYNNYKDAWIAMTNSGVSGSFVVAYINGKRLLDITSVAKPVNSSNFKNRNTAIKGVEYRIQIGVSVIPADKNQLRRLNPTNLKVKTYKSRRYYKYTIGKFDTIQEAVYFKNSNNLKKTVIVKYKNGREIIKS